MAKSVLFNIYGDLTSAMKTVIGAKYIFLKDRPKIEQNDTPMAKFAVIDLPVSIDDYVIGNNKTMLTTSGASRAVPVAITISVSMVGQLTRS